MKQKKYKPFRLNTALSLCVVLVTWIVSISSASANELISGKFDLIDHDGRPVTEETYNGQLRLVFFGFTQCPHICPMTLAEIRRVMQQLGDDASEVQPLFISVDRENDTPERIAAYVGGFHPSVIGLTGSEAQIEAAARSFNVQYKVTPADDNGDGQDKVFHSSYLFLLDRDGRFLDVFGFGAKAEEISARLGDYL